MRAFLTLVVALVFCSSSSAASWESDYSAAVAKARTEKKALLINFTGSDWCGWCVRLHKEVFSQREFDQYAADNLILVEIDFPRRKKQSAALRAANEQLARKFGVEGFPTLILLNSEGKRIGQLGYEPGGPAAFIASLQKHTGKNPVAAAKAKIGAAVASREEPPPVAAPAPPPPAPKYEDLILKGISGPPNNRLALINNQTLGVGESGAVRLSIGNVKIRCEEIRNNSVIVTINGAADRQELFMRGL